MAEFFGTFWLVFAGVGSMVLSASFPRLGIGYVGIALAFGFALITMTYALGHISGCHLNPAVSVGLWVGRRFPAREVIPYGFSQLVGAISAAYMVFFIARGQAGYATQSFAANGFGTLSPGVFSMGSCFLAEVVLTFLFMMVVLGATDHRAAKGFAPLAIGFGLAVIYLLGLPITNGSVNPARSTAAALVAGRPWLIQLWMFWVAPLIGAALGGLFYRLALAEPATSRPQVKPLTYEAD